ncbi:MAG: AbrB/MazE/SpoVT family DNA-binding domain-containing protein [Candidatus Latescibacterota bacterium]
MATCATSMGQVTIPMAVRRRLGVRRGDEVQFGAVSP